MRNCTRDEGRSFGFGDQVADPKPPRAAAVKSRGGERRGNAGTMIPAGMVERGERKQTDECRKRIRRPRLQILRRHPRPLLFRLE